MVNSTRQDIDNMPRDWVILAACIVGFDPPKKDQPPLEGAEADGETASSTTA